MKEKQDVFLADITGCFGSLIPRNSEGIKGKYFCKFVYEKIQTHNRIFDYTMCSSWE